MQFVLIAYDKAGALPLRMATRAAHLTYCEQEIGARLIFGGPIQTEDGSPRGSILVIEAEDEAEARRIFDSDPYKAVGLFGEITISRFRHIFSNGKQI